MLRVPRVPDGLQELGIAPDASHVLWRAGTLPVQHPGRLRFGACGQYGFEQDVMLPAVAEVILVAHAVAGFAQDILEPGLPLADAAYPELRVGLAIEGLAPLELVQVAVRPPFPGRGAGTSGVWTLCGRSPRITSAKQAPGLGSMAQ